MAWFSVARSREEEAPVAVTIKEITLWRREIDNQPGALAGVLEQLARAGMDVTVLMAYRYPGNESRGAVEVYPIVGKKATAAAQTAVLAPSNISALLVQGDNRSGLGYTTTQAIADGGINLAFLVAQVIGKKYSAVFRFRQRRRSTEGRRADQEGAPSENVAGRQTLGGDHDGELVALRAWMRAPDFDAAVCHR